MSSLKILLLLFGASLQAVSFSEENPKQAIEKCLRQLHEEKEQDCETLKALAFAYLKDQDIVSAFQTALTAVEKMEKKSKTPLQEEEQLYEEALQIYLEHNGPFAPQENAKKLLTKYTPVLKENPEYRLLNFLVAASYANLGQYKEFLEQFFRSYESFHDHYMAFKTKAVLHIKLHERVSSLEEKEAHRKKVVENAKKGLEKYPKDPGLYKLIILFAKADEKGEEVSLSLSKILEGSMIVPRADIAFFVQQAVKCKRKDLAEKLIEKAKKWYEFSRVVQAAENYVRDERE